MILDNQWTAKVTIYPLLCGALGQCIAVAEVVDLNVLDVVTILLVRIAADLGSRVGRGRLGDGRRGHLACVSWLRVHHRGVRAVRTERMGGTSTCWMPFFAWICALILAAAAAAAAAFALTAAAAGLSVPAPPAPAPAPASIEPSRAIGLRSRCASDSRRDGERDRRSVSKRDRLGGSGSSLSKRERGRRSSDMWQVYGQLWLLWLLWLWR